MFAHSVTKPPALNPIARKGCRVCFHKRPLIRSLYLVWQGEAVKYSVKIQPIYIYIYTYMYIYIYVYIYICIIIYVYIYI